jgi:nucleoside-diphosphate-sugar epimerase
MIILITGTDSGFGKYVHSKLGGLAINRKTESAVIEKVMTEGADIIIHAAFNPKEPHSSNELYGHLEDNIFLTQKLTTITHKKFIYISSVDIYPKRYSNDLHSETDIISVKEADSFYAVTKLMAESIVMRKSTSPLILRCTALLGIDSRRNSLMKILFNEDPVLTLSGDSNFNYVLHSDVLSFIQLAIRNCLTGVYNIASSTNISLQEIAAEYGRKVTFGTYTYCTGNICNQKALTVLPAFLKTSLEVVSQFWEEVRK